MAAVVALALSGCGAPPSPVTPPANDTPTPLATSTPAPMPAVPTSTPTPDLAAQGRAVFERKSGTLSAGCTFCHGEDGSGRFGPDVRGKSAADIKRALETVPQMRPLVLSEEEVAGLAAYLAYLQAHP